jgi:hypothetical protein
MMATLKRGFLFEHTDKGTITRIETGDKNHG